MKSRVRRSIALATAFVMAFGALVAFAPVNAYAAPAVLYDLAEDEMLQMQEPGHVMGENIYPAAWMQAGGGMAHEVVEAPRGHNGIRQFQRQQDWNGMDFQTNNVPGVNFATGDFVIFARGRSATDMETMAIQQVTSPWLHLQQYSVASDGSWEFFIPSSLELINERQADAGEGTPAGFQLGVRVNPVGHRGDFYLYEFVVAELGWTPDMLGGGAAAADEPTPADPTEEVATDEPTEEPTDEPTPAEPTDEPTEAAPVDDPTPIAVPLPLPADVTTLRFVVGSTTYSTNGVSGTLEAAPFNQDGRVMVPLRQIGEAIGAAVIAFEDNTAIIDDIRLPIGVELAGGMGTPVIVEGRTFVPLGYIAQRIGATPRWDGAANAAYIYID